MEGATYFVTIRTADSLAAEHLDRLKEERRALERNTPKTAVAQQKIAAVMMERLDAMLDLGHGSQPLRFDPVAEIVANAFRFFDTERYELLTWCVMPNHAHVLFRPFAAIKLADVVGSWKSFTSKEIGKVTNTAGRFWAREYYDHVARSEEEILRIDQYIRENPVKAGLREWKWVDSAIVPASGRS